MLRSASCALAVLCGVSLATVAALPPAAAAAPLASSREGKCTTADTAAVTLVIDYQQLGGGVDEYCVSGLTASATGWDVLKAAGVTAAGTVHDGQSFMCRLNGVPGLSQVIPITGDPDYVEKCVDTPPPSAYWTYWWARPGGDWTYSQLGAMSHKVTLGGFEGWSFALNAAPSAIPQPRAKPVPLRVRATSQKSPQASTTPADTPSDTTKTVAPAPAEARRTAKPDPSGAASESPAASGAASAPAAVQPSQVADLSPDVAPAESSGDGTATIWALLALAGLAVAAGVIVMRRRRGTGDR